MNLDQLKDCSTIVNRQQQVQIKGGTTDTSTSQNIGDGDVDVF